MIIIDEIGRELEAVAARTIAERGVQLIGTAHGNTLDNLLNNPTLCDLVGGIESVTLSDEEARRRGTQKSVLERKASPTFDVLIEIQDRQRMAIHHDVAASVDAFLRGRALSPEVRSLSADGSVQIERSAEYAPSARPEMYGATHARRRAQPEREFAAAPVGNGNGTHLPELEENWADHGLAGAGPGVGAEDKPPGGQGRKTIRLFPYGIGENRLRSAAASLNVPINLVEHLNSADAVVTLKNYYRQQPQPLVDAERRNIPIYILRSNTITQIEQCLVDMFHLGAESHSAFDLAMRETQLGIQRILNGASDLELSPQSAAIRSQQHQLVRAANLISHSYGREPYRRVRIFRR